MEFPAQLTCPSSRSGNLLVTRSAGIPKTMCIYHPLAFSCTPQGSSPLPREHILATIQENPSSLPERAATNGMQLSSSSLGSRRNSQFHDEQYRLTHLQPVSRRSEYLGLVDTGLCSACNSICSWYFFFPCSCPSLREQHLLVSTPQCQSVNRNITFVSASF